jgi:hypothetical protein
MILSTYHNLTTNKTFQLVKDIEGCVNLRSLTIIMRVSKQIEPNGNMV